MEKTRFKRVRLLLKLILFFQIYYHIKIEAEAAEHYLIAKSFDGIETGDSGETGSSDQKFEKEIGDDVFERLKRPYRLLPLKMFR